MTTKTQTTKRSKCADQAYFPKPISIKLHLDLDAKLKKLILKGIDYSPKLKLWFITPNMDCAYSLDIRNNTVYDADSKERLRYQAFLVKKGKSVKSNNYIPFKDLAVNVIELEKDLSLDDMRNHYFRWVTEQKGHTFSDPQYVVGHGSIILDDKKPNEKHEGIFIYPITSPRDINKDDEMFFSELLKFMGI